MTTLNLHPPRLTALTVVLIQHLPLNAIVNALMVINQTSARRKVLNILKAAKTSSSVSLRWRDPVITKIFKRRSIKLITSIAATCDLHKSYPLLYIIYY
jgi:hypothetical protein